MKAEQLKEVEAVKNENPRVEWKQIKDNRDLDEVERETETLQL